MSDNEAMKAHIEKALDESRRAAAQLEAAMSNLDRHTRFQVGVVDYLAAAAANANNARYYIERAQSI